MFLNLQHQLEKIVIVLLLSWKVPLVEALGVAVTVSAVPLQQTTDVVMYISTTNHPAASPGNTRALITLNTAL